MSDNEVCRCTVTRKTKGEFLFEKLRQRIVEVGTELLVPEILEQRGGIESRDKKRREKAEPVRNFSPEMVGVVCGIVIAGRRKIRIKSLQVFEFLPKRFEFFVCSKCPFHFEPVPSQ
jgi:hypothetical protein